MSLGGPLSCTAQTFTPAGAAERSTDAARGSTTTENTSRNAFCRSRFLITTCTGPAGSGKRSDSEKARRISFASSVLSHSP